ncbi:MAG: tRNA guanosine(34) transglycosylase Tgt [Rhodospirillaceae bacterium]|nr:MAG: tRNA guanosine(34) transglycosylase Tgt [Rhodospirillaceae bacterium]
MTEFSFDLKASDGTARRGEVHTAHGAIQTPAFMPVGTAATVKAMLPGSVKATGAEIILGNTYHLMLRPTAERIERLGGLHKFMNWPGPILTDSGGFQVMSLNDLRKLNENGVIFRSHIDGSKHELTPERSIEIQHMLDADITMCFDECPPFPCEKSEVKRATELSMRWAKRSKDAFVKRPGYGLFGICQGGVHDDLREQSAKALVEIGFDGYAIGGLAVGEGRQRMFDALELTTPHLPTDKPRYLMGVGKPEDIVGAVARGVDMFDCVLPTRSGRTAQAWTHNGAVNMRNARHADDHRPIEEGCACPACSDHSRAYIRHLIQAKEILGSMLLTWHNLHYYQVLMSEIREAISEGRFADFQREFAEAQAQGDIEALE